jgi:hypothetical protein
MKLKKNLFVVDEENHLKMTGAVWYMFHVMA